MGVIPIVNENDTLAVSEIKFGDNDTLSAITAAMVHADLLFLMTDVDCLYDKNPRSHPDAQPIEVVEDIGAIQADGNILALLVREKRRTELTYSPHTVVSSAGSSLGTGGMSTKIVAARLATSAGVTTVITRASSPGNISKIVQHIEASKSPASLLTQANGTEDPHHAPAAEEDALAQSTASLQSLDMARRSVPLHTRFLPSPYPIRDRSFWILHGLKPHGDVYIDAGCYKALLNKAGLLPVGVVDVDGTFSGHECVRLLVVEKTKDAEGTNNKLWHGEPQDVGRAIVNYPSVDVHRIKGHQSKEIEGLLGYADSGYVAEREHVTLFRPTSRPQTPTPMGLGTPTTTCDCKQ